VISLAPEETEDRDVKNTTSYKGNQTGIVEEGRERMTYEPSENQAKIEVAV